MENDIKTIIPNTDSAVAKAINELAWKHKIIFVTVGAEADSLTGADANRYVFRTCFTTGNRSWSFAEFFKTKPWRKFYLINMDYAMERSASDDFK